MLPFCHGAAMSACDSELWAMSPKLQNMNNRTPAAAGSPSLSTRAKFCFSETASPGPAIGHYLILLRQRYAARNQGRLAERRELLPGDFAHSEPMTFVTQS